MPLVERLNKLITEDRRLVILRLLHAVADYSLNSVVLSQAMHELGHAVSYDVLKSEVAWLAEQGLLRFSEPSQDMYVLTLTQRGKDVAIGSTKVPGVKLPEPGLDDNL
jgi:hypothetical protein